MLSVCTFGLYDLYWFYKNWERVAWRRREALSPFWRTVFAGIWNFGLFREVKDFAGERGVKAGWSPILLGSVYLAMSVLMRLPKTPALFGLLFFLPILPVVLTIHRIHEMYRGLVTEPVNDNFSGWNIVALVVGGVMVLLAIVGTFLPASGTQ